MSTDDNKDQAGNKKIEFTPEQQEKVNQLIQDAMGRAAKDVREQAATFERQLNEAKTQLTDAQNALKNASTEKEKKEAKGDVAALQAQIDEMKNAHKNSIEDANRFKALAQQKDEEVKQARQETINVQKRVAIAEAASKLNFVNSQVVSKLTEDAIRWDNDKGRFVVVGKNDQPRLNAAFEPMSLEEYYTEFASQNPYLVRGDVKSGIGSNSRNDVSNNGRFEVTQIFGRKSDSRLASQLMKENPQEYHRLKKIAVEQHLVAG